MNNLINRLNEVKFEIKPSKIHGVGLFATKNIQKNKVVFNYNENDVVCLSQEILKKEGVDLKTLRRYCAHTKEYICVPKNFSPYFIHIVQLMNHSTSPTLYYNFDTKEYHAKKNIKKGTELTLDYTVGTYVADGILDFKTKTPRRRRNTNKKRRSTKGKRIA